MADLVIQADALHSQQLFAHSPLMVVSRGIRWRETRRDTWSMPTDFPVLPTRLNPAPTAWDNAVWSGSPTENPAPRIVAW